MNSKARRHRCLIATGAPQGRRSSRRLLVCTVAVVLVLVAAACSSDASTETGGTATGTSGVGGATPLRAGYVNGGDATATPVSGGTLHFSEASPPSTLDPASPQGTGANGAVEMAAIYGVLMRYDPVAGEYHPKLAESLTSSEDFKTWTLKLRPDVYFTDGTLLDSQAVVFSMKRYGATKKAPVEASVVRSMIASFETPDPRTVVFHLEEPWAQFPYLLSSTAGMIVSPTAAKAKGGAFGEQPVGAGPFKVSTFVPGERIEMTRNDGYWGQKPYLDGLTFTFLRNPAPTLDRLQASQVQMIYLLDDEAAVEAIRDGLPGFIALANAYGVFLNNARPPLDDPRLRQAIAAGLNLDQLDQRVSNDTSLYAPTIFWKGSPWYPDTAGPAHDPAKAKQLVQQVKADTGWDGKLEFLRPSTNPPDLALTLQAQLKAIGIDLSLRSVPTITQFITELAVNRNYQLAAGGMTAWDSDPWVAMNANLTSTSRYNFVGYENPAMDQLINELQKAPTPEAAKPILTEIQRVFTQDVPYIVLRPQAYAAFWARDVHGVVPTSKGVVLFDKAFIGQ